jgi:tetratricopeptide (TPR) repeat protein
MCNERSVWGRLYRHLKVWGAICFFLSVPGIASAAESLPDRAASAFNDGDYLEAARLLEEAFAQDPQPLYLFNIGRAYQEARRWKNAVSFFERYLRTAPSGERRQTAKHHLAAVVAQLPPPPKPIPPPPPPGPERPLAPWLLTGAGVLSVGAAGALFFMANNRRESVKSATQDEFGVVTSMSQERAFALRDEADGLATSGAVLGGIGATAIAVGTVWAVLSWDGTVPDSGLEVAPGVSGLSVGWTATF